LTNPDSLGAPAQGHRVRAQETGTNTPTGCSDAIDRMYAGNLDVLIARGAVAPDVMRAAGDRMDRDDASWARPNEKMPIEDIQVLGTDTPATPTYSAPRGATLDEYLASADRHRHATDQVFPQGFDTIGVIERELSKYAGGRPVEIPVAEDGRRYVPFTVRRLVDGRQIGAHHDYHYPLAMYKDLAPRLDTRTLISYVVTLRRPESGGDLWVYGVTPETPAPKLPNGFSYDMPAVEAAFDSAHFSTDAGDLFLLASGRCLHRIEKVSGPRARVTLGGFLALDRDGSRVYYWS
jgi:hypothetical protein